MKKGHSSRPPSVGARVALALGAIGVAPASTQEWNGAGRQPEWTFIRGNVGSRQDYGD